MVLSRVQLLLKHAPSFRVITLESIIHVLHGPCIWYADDPNKKVNSGPGSTSTPQGLWQVVGGATLVWLLHRHTTTHTYTLDQKNEPPTYLTMNAIFHLRKYFVVQNWLITSGLSGVTFIQSFSSYCAAPSKWPLCSAGFPPLPPALFWLDRNKKGVGAEEKPHNSLLYRSRKIAHLLESPEMLRVSLSSSPTLLKYSWWFEWDKY